MVQNSNLLITAALAIVIVIAVGAYAYTNFFDPVQKPEDENNDLIPNEINDQNNEEISLTIQYLETNYTFSLSDLEKMGSESGSGRYIKTGWFPDIVLGDSQNYTGVTIRNFLDKLNITIENYQIITYSSDNRTRAYTLNETNGQVDIYNENGEISANESATMIVAYKEDGVYYSEIDEGKEEDDMIGPFRIAFIGDSTPITSSNLWSRMVTTIEIVNLS